MLAAIYAITDGYGAAPAGSVSEYDHETLADSGGVQGWRQIWLSEKVYGSLALLPFSQVCPRVFSFTRLEDIRATSGGLSKRP